MNLDYNHFPGVLENAQNLNIPDFKSTDDGSKAWKYYDSNHASDFQKVVSFQYQNQVPGDDDPLNYRAWWMETSVVGDNLGLLVSCKVDYDRGSRDDHMTLICGFDHAGKLLIAQAATQFHGASDKNFRTDLITSDVSSNVAQALHDAMYNIQKKVDYGDDRDNAGRKGLAYVAQMTVTGLAQSVRQ